MTQKFQFQRVNECLKAILQNITDNSEVPFSPFIQFLELFCSVFPQISSFLGLAFNDITKKVNHFNINNKRFPGHKGFISFILMQMKNNIHILNGDNSKHQVSNELQNYSSTARNLLRMMWLITFIKVTFQSFQKDPTEQISSIFNRSYDTAFGQKHSWVLRQAAKVGISATSGGRQNFVTAMVGKYDQQKFKTLNNTFLKLLQPVYQYLWGFYQKYHLTQLE